MELGIGSYSCAWAVGVPGYPPVRPMSAMNLVDLAGEVGVRVVQIADNLPLGNLSERELDALRDRATARGVALEAGTRGIGRDHLARHIAICRRLGSRLLRVVVDTADDQPAPDEIVVRLREVVPELAKADVVLGVENHDRFTAGTLADIIRRAGSDRVGVCLDTVNSFGALEGPGVVVETLGPLTVNLHVKDFAISRLGHMMGFVIEGRPAGQGRLDVPELLSRLEAHGRCASAILELWTPYQGKVEETVRLERAWLDESVAYLKGLVGQREDSNTH